MILVTGATGLVGSHLILHLLENNKKVRAVYRNNAALEKTKSLFRLYKKEHFFDRAEWVQADITDVTSLEKIFPGVDYVYHCAALISFDASDEKILRKTNIEGTANIVNFCLAHQIKKLCYVSSIAALGDLKEFDPTLQGEMAEQNTITEETEWNPELTHSDYAISKHGAEMEVWRGQQEGLTVAIINPGVILGAGFWESGSGLIFKQIADGLHFYTKGMSGFVCVDDVVRSMVLAMESPTNGEQFIVVGENISYEKLLVTIAKSLQVKSPTWYASPFLTEIYWHIDAFLSLFGKKRTLDKLTARTLHQKQLFSSEKIRSELGFEFKSIEQCITEVSRYYPKK